MPHEGEICELSVASAVQRRRNESGELYVPASVSVLNIGADPEQFSREQSIREAVVLSFCDPLPDKRLLLAHLSGREWKRLLEWLDISGLALYFLDRVVELQICDMLPAAVVDRLQQNLIDNTSRTRGIIAESVELQREFQKAGLSYATMKGFSLYPSSVPKLELRHQFDLDFLIAEKSASEARQILERRGYRLRMISGRTWEFKIHEIPRTSLKDFYKDLPGKSVELHLETNIPSRPSMLDRIDTCEFYGISMPVLSSVDLFLGQGLHVYKDICSEFSRAAHLLEFRRHVLARYDDKSFWSELQSAAEENPRVALGLGVAAQLITHVMGSFAPEAFTNWTVGSLPPPVLSWVERYGYHAVFKSFPGSKLYLLLQKELESAGIPAKRPLWRALLPLRLPPSLIRTPVNETLSLRIRRYRMQLHHIFSRMRFHILEGLRYAQESRRWQQYMNRVV